jgi:hypothetical protein
MEEKFLYISIEKYDTIFDQWLQETESYMDHFIINKLMKKFDVSMGIEHALAYPSDEEDLDTYKFKVIDGQKFILAVIKYDLYDK